MGKFFTKIIIFAVLVFIPLCIHAASLSFSTQQNSYYVGDTFSVTVYVDSADQAMNAASGIVAFPWDKLQVVSISKNQSIFSFWVEEPSFLNNLGTINFEGVVLNPGFTGAKGKILTITFKTKISGTANLSFSSGSVLANDGSGTNILNGLGVMVVNIADKSSAVSSPAIQPNLTQSSSSGGNLPVINSATHPDQSRWYSDNNPEFSWDLPDGALEVRTSIGTSQNGIPTVGYIPPIKDKKVLNLVDGIYYFNLQIRTASGWGEIAHYKVNIDTTPPKSFSITFPHGKESLDPQSVILFNTEDNLSGINHYDIKIGEGGPDRVAPSALSNPYILPSQYPGTHIVTVTAYDNSGNSTTASTEFVVTAIDFPKITYYPEQIQVGDVMKIRGTTYPNSDINIIIKKDSDVVSEESARSNSTGDFSLIVVKRLDVGVYTFTARVTDERGAKSNETDPLTFEVKSKFLVDLTTFVINYLSISILVVLVLVGIISFCFFMWYKLKYIISRLRRENTEMEKIAEKSFNILKKDIEEHISLLKKTKSSRGLTEEEILFLSNFDKDLEEAEGIIASKAEGFSGNKEK